MVFEVNACCGKIVLSQLADLGYRYSTSAFYIRSCFPRRKIKLAEESFRCHFVQSALKFSGSFLLP